MTTVNINEAYWGYFNSNDHDAVSATPQNDFGLVGQNHSGTTYYYYRSWLIFDTSVLPSGANITSLKLNVRASPTTIFGISTLNVLSGMPTYPHIPVVANDYNKTNYSDTSLGSLASSAISSDQYYAITLSTSLLNLSGYTKFFLRSSNDINSVDPTGAEYINYSAGGYLPYLEVIYSPCTVTTLPATNVTQTTATLNGSLDSIIPGNNADCGFEWGTTTSYGNTTATVNLSSPAVFSQAIAGLSVQQYHYRAFATDVVSGSTYYGLDFTFTIFKIIPAGMLNIAPNVPIFTDTTNPVSSIWTSITTDFISVKIDRGRKHQADRIEAGTMTVVLNNSSGNYWRDNPASPFYNISTVQGYFKPVTLIQLCGWDPINNVYVPQFTGIIEQIKPDWIDSQYGKTPIVTITAADMFKVFSYYDLPTALMPVQYVGGTFTRAAEYGGERFNWLLDIIGFPSGDMRNIAPGQFYITKIALKAGNGSTAADTLNLQEHINAIVKAEQGYAFIAGNGSVVFLDSISRQTTTIYWQPQDSFIDNGSGHGHYASPDFVDDDQFTYNVAHIDGDAIHPGVDVYNKDQSDPTIPASQTHQFTNGPRKYSDTGSVINYVDDAWNMAYKIQNRYQDSALRSQGLLILPDSDPTGQLYSDVFKFDLGTCIKLTLNTPYNPAAIATLYNIEAIHHSWKWGERWETNWELWNSDAFRVFSVNHDGWLQETDTTSYAAIQSASSCNYTPTYDAANVQAGQKITVEGSGNIWTIFRGYLEFDTTTLTASPTILKAWLAVNLLMVNYLLAQSVDNREFELCVVSPGTVVPAWPVTIQNGTGTGHLGGTSLVTVQPLAYGDNTIHVDSIGSFTVYVPPEVTAYAIDIPGQLVQVVGAAPLYPITLVSGNNILSTVGQSGNFMIVVAGVSTYGLQKSDYGKLLTSTEIMNTSPTGSPLTLPPTNIVGGYSGQPDSLNYAETMYIVGVSIYPAGDTGEIDTDPQYLLPGINTVNVFSAGILTIVLPPGCTGTVYNGTASILNSPVPIGSYTSVVPTINQITTSANAAGGTFIIVINFAGWVYLPLTADGVALINAGGITRFGLRSNHDITPSEPPSPTSGTYNEYANIGGNGGSPPIAARLIVQLNIY